MYKPVSVQGRAPKVLVECSLVPLPLRIRMRANAAIMVAWLRRRLPTIV